MKVLNPTFLTIVLGAKVILGSFFFCFMEADTLFSTQEAVASDQKKGAIPVKAGAIPVKAGAIPVKAGAIPVKAGAIPVKAGAIPVKAGAIPVKGAEEDLEGVENVSMDFLLKKNAELEKREKDLDKRKMELTAIEDDINGKIAKLEQLRSEIRSHVESKRAFEEQKLKHLVKAYSAMKPQAAANVIEKLELSFAVEILSRMQGDTVGGILFFVDKEKAAKISETLAKQK